MGAGSRGPSRRPRAAESAAATSGRASGCHTANIPRLHRAAEQIRRRHSAACGRGRGRGTACGTVARPGAVRAFGSRYAGPRCRHAAGFRGSPERPGRSPLDRAGSLVAGERGRRTGSGEVQRVGERMLSYMGRQGHRVLLAGWRLTSYESGDGRQKGQSRSAMVETRNCRSSKRARRRFARWLASSPKRSAEDRTGNRARRWLRSAQRAPAPESWEQPESTLRARHECFFLSSTVDGHGCSGATGSSGPRGCTQSPWWTHVHWSRLLSRFFRANSRFPRSGGVECGG